MMLYQLGFGVQGQIEPNIVAGVLGSFCFDLDATLAESYDGAGQIWSNLMETPADGAGRGDYDFYRGADDTATAADPTFSGTAGSSDAYWSFDGGDAFKMAGSAGFVEALHKTGAPDFTILCAFRFQENNFEQRLLSTQGSSGTSPGITLGFNSAERVLFRQRGDSAAISAVLNSAILVSGTDYLCIVSHSNTTGKTRFWLNSRSKVEVAHSFNPGTGNALPLVIGARSTLSAEFLANTTRLYAAGLLNSFIDDSDAALLFDLFNTRHGRIYA